METIIVIILTIKDKILDWLTDGRWTECAGAESSRVVKVNMPK